jgi:hypothetical protein
VPRSISSGVCLRNAECGSTVLYLDGYLGFECWAEEASLLETHLANVLTL